MNRSSVSSARVRTECARLGFDLAGITAVRSSEHGEFLRDWLSKGMHGTMTYLEREDAIDRRLHMEAAYPELRSALVVGIDYGDGRDHDDSGPEHGIIARYARGRDYHKVIRRKLLELLRWLERESGAQLPLARAAVDSSPVLERELARRAGLGWFGRNTMLINPRRGSYFFLGVLLVELEFDELDAPFERDHCGTCNACVDACPTGALLGRDERGAPVIDATRCISYLTIENRGPIPRELRPLIGNRVFGCDICQEVCPFTRFARPASQPAFAARDPGEPPFGVERSSSHARHPGTESPSLIELMGMDEASWDAFSRGSPIRRVGRVGFLRNVAVALGNWGSEEAAPVLARALSDSDPLVRGHAAWALGRIGSAEARASLVEALSSEGDEFVRVELSNALSRQWVG